MSTTYCPQAGSGKWEHRCYLGIDANALDEGFSGGPRGEMTAVHVRPYHRPDTPQLHATSA